MNREQMGIILEPLTAPLPLLRMGATTVNAGFTMANVVKDFVGTLLLTQRVELICELNLV